MRHSRFLILSLAFCSLAMMVAALWYYQRQRAALDAAAVNQLAAVANFKTGQIANWRRERIGDGRALAVSPLMRNAQRILSGRGAAADRTAMRDVMVPLSREFLYRDVMLVDLEGRVCLRLNESRTSPSPGQATLLELARKAVKAKDVVLSDLIKDTGLGRPFMAVTIPVNSEGALILEIDPAAFLYPYLRSWPTPSRTAETFLMRLESLNSVLVLSDLRYAPGSALTYRSSFKPSEVPDDQRLRSGWFHRGLSYYGVPALKVTRRVPDSPWYLTAEIDQSEVEAPLVRLGWEMTLVVALIAVTNAAGVGLIWRSRQLQAVSEQEAWFRSVANDTPAYLWMSKPGDKDSFVNKPLETFLGSGRHLFSVDWVAAIHPDDSKRGQEWYVECWEARREYTDEFRVQRFDGAYRWVIAHGVPRLSTKGDFLGYAGCLVDITERREAEEQLRSANSVLADQLAERTRAEQAIHALSARLIHAQEEERARLARELHDDISQQIAALSIGVSNLKRKVLSEGDAKAQSQRIQERLIQLADSTRRLSHQLHPAILQHAGLAVALRSYCAEVAALTAHRIDYRAEGQFDGLPGEVALCVYRVGQEALQNSIKHAHVSEVEVVLTQSDGVVCLVVSDHGVGMEPSAVGGLGLVSMKERARLVNGTVEVNSQPGAGVTVTLRVPIPATEQPMCAASHEA